MPKTSGCAHRPGSGRPGDDRERCAVLGHQLAQPDGRTVQVDGDPLQMVPESVLAHSAAPRPAALGTANTPNLLRFGHPPRSRWPCRTRRAMTSLGARGAATATSPPTLKNPLDATPVSLGFPEPPTDGVSAFQRLEETSAPVGERARCRGRLRRAFGARARGTAAAASAFERARSRESSILIAPYSCQDTRSGWLSPHQGVALCTCLLIEVVTALWRSFPQPWHPRSCVACPGRFFSLRTYPDVVGT